jgi:hypothetical protein
MADLGEAFNTLKFQKKTFQNIDYFFTQRTLTEEHEYIDKNMVRKNKKIKVTHNFLALNIPTIICSINNNEQMKEKPLGFDIEIYGDEGYHYKGLITSYEGTIPNFMIPMKGDKKLFININYKFSDSNENTNMRKFINFIEVPKRFQNIDDNESDIELYIYKENKKKDDSDIIEIYISKENKKKDDSDIEL